MLILAVCFLNAIFALVLSVVKRSRHKKRLYEQFNLERTPHIGCCVITIVAAIDMFYVFFLFWPANVIPIAFLITLLQLFIPLNMLLRRWCLRQGHHRTHLLAGTLIFVGCGLVFVRMDYNNKEMLNYTLLFLISSVLEVVSQSIKESLVRSKPLNTDKFNFKISLG